MCFMYWGIVVYSWGIYVYYHQGCIATIEPLSIYTPLE